MFKRLLKSSSKHRSEIIRESFRCKGYTVAIYAQKIVELQVALCFRNMAFDAGVVYRILECSCGMKFHCAKTDDAKRDLNKLHLRIFSHKTSVKDHTAMSWDDVVALKLVNLTPARCTCYGRKDCTPLDERRILCPNCGRWFRRRTAGGSDSEMSQRDYSPASRHLSD